jgi:hypothetical protein
VIDPICIRARQKLAIRGKTEEPNESIVVVDDLYVGQCNSASIVVMMGLPVEEQICCENGQAQPERNNERARDPVPPPKK